MIYLSSLKTYVVKRIVWCIEPLVLDMVVTFSSDKTFRIAPRTCREW